jgi:hyperosmotically inducible periplasmic protein
MEATMKTNFSQFLAAIITIASTGLAAPSIQQQAGNPPVDLQKEVMDTILWMPRFGVFDNLAFELQGADVTLLGQVVMPITKVEAELRVKKISGIGKIVNKIEVLPVSQNDDLIRVRVFRGVFGTSNLDRYAMGPNPSIHIIVKNGHVTLEGVVSTKEDSDLALLAVRGIEGIFSVKNNLTIEK